MGLWSGSAGARTRQPIIDTHIHLYDPARAQGVPWPPKDDRLLYRRVLPEAYAAMVRPLGVTGAIVVEASPWLEDNQWVLDLAKDNPIIAGFVGHLEPGTPGFNKNLARFGKNTLFRGIRLDGKAITDGIARSVFVEDLRRLADAGRMLDAIGSAAMLPALITLASRVPNLRIAVDHMPNEPTGWMADEASRAAMRELARQPQVYCKVSGMLRRANGAVEKEAGAYRSALDPLWEMFGENRVMYGSNWPVSDGLAAYPVVFRTVQEYVKSRGAMAAGKFFATNARECYRWIDRT